MNGEIYLVYFKPKKGKKELLGFTRDRDDFELFMEQRKDKKGYKYRVVDELDYPRGYFDSMEMFDKEIADAFGYMITNEEYAYFIEAWNDYQAASIDDIKRFLEDIQFLNFTKKEKTYVKKLCKVLNEYAHDYTHGIVDEVEETGTYYNMENAIKFFVEHIL